MKSIVSNVRIYDMEEAIAACKYAFLADTAEATWDVTKRQIDLASSPTGHGHDNFLSGILVSFDLTCSNKMWVEFERYHFKQIVTSQSTMHTITKFDIKDCCNEYVSPLIIEECEYLKGRYLAAKQLCLDDPTTERAQKREEEFLHLIYSLPSGFRLTARVTTNYLQLKTMLQQREFHRLPEWREFCEWIKTLPHAEEFLIQKREKAE